MRRLPIYILLDTSKSMEGEPIESVKVGLETLTTTLRSDPHALETAHISIITFGSRARQVVPLTDILSFQPPDIRAWGSTPMGGALSLVADRIRDEVRKSTPDQKADWKPLVFLMTDGIPTDHLDSGVAELRKVKTGMVVACAAGPNADKDLLMRITENVVSLDTLDNASISAFFKWISASISATSQKVDLGKQDNKGDDGATLEDLPPPPPEINLH